MKFNSFKILKIFVMTKIYFLARKINFDSIISVRSTPLREIGRIRIRTSDLQIRIREAPKLTDPEHWYKYAAGPSTVSSTEGHERMRYRRKLT
jgi:hypothetical protein